MVVAGKRKVDISAVIGRGDAVLEAIRRGGLEAMRRHVQAGVPMVGCKDGQVVHIPPEQLSKILKAAESADRPK
jgi:hypothetical protein